MLTGVERSDPLRFIGPGTERQITSRLKMEGVCFFNVLLQKGQKEKLAARIDATENRTRGGMHAVSVEQLAAISASARCVLFLIFA